MIYHLRESSNYYLLDYGSVECFLNIRFNTLDAYVFGLRLTQFVLYFKDFCKLLYYQIVMAFSLISPFL